MIMLGSGWLASPFNVFSQSFVKYYHGPWNDWWTHTYTNDFIVTNDGGYAIVGSSNEHGVIIKLSADGTLQWSRLFKGHGYQRETSFSSIIQTHDGGYAAVGTAYAPEGIGWTDILVVRLDSGGGVLWEKLYGRKRTNDNGDIWESGQKIYETNLGGNWVLHVTGLANYAYVPGCPYAGYLAGLILVLDSSSGVKSADYVVSQHAGSMTTYMTADGGYLVTSVPPFGNPYDVYSLHIHKYNAGGALIWSKGVFEKKSTYYLGLEEPSMTEVSDGYVLSAKTYDNRVTPSLSAANLVKISKDGNSVLWHYKTRVYPDWTGVWPNQIVTAFDGGTLVSINSGVTTNDDVVLKSGPVGTLEWAKRFTPDLSTGGPDIGRARSVGGNYAAATNGTFDLIFALLDDTGNLAQACSLLPVTSAAVTTYGPLASEMTHGYLDSGCNTYLGKAAVKDVVLLVDGAYSEIGSCYPTPAPSATAAPADDPAVLQAQQAIQRIRSLLKAARKSIPLAPPPGASKKSRAKYKAVKTAITRARSGLQNELKGMGDLLAAHGSAIAAKYPQCTAAKINAIKLLAKKACSKRTDKKAAAKLWRQIDSALRSLGV